MQFRERDALMRQLNLAGQREAIEADGCVGRCCLRPGSLAWGGKWACEKQGFKVKGGRVCSFEVLGV